MIFLGHPKVARTFSQIVWSVYACQATLPTFQQLKSCYLYCTKNINVVLWDGLKP